jgi:AraC-like DNA-binding protein
VAHQTVEVEPGTRFVCIYLPLEMFLGAKLSDALRSATLGGGMVVASDPAEFDPKRLQHLVEDARKRADLRRLELLAAEVMLVLQRLDVTGWRDILAGQHAPGRAMAGAMPPKVVEMARFIAEHGHEPITVRDVARAANLHPNYAMTRFRTALGLTIASYILRHRMMTAQTLLVSTRKDLAALAFDSGFGSVSQFHRSFRTYFGFTPAEFRRRALACDSWTAMPIARKQPEPDAFSHQAELLK